MKVRRMFQGCSDPRHTKLRRYNWEAAVDSTSLSFADPTVPRHMLDVQLPYLQLYP